ncbi:MAG: trehalose-phosphatase [Verrucomicrobia bacterium]|nr:MAG: trehalose-phosphatase [Verrucomicrobiota bacterium]
MGLKKLHCYNGAAQEPFQPCNLVTLLPPFAKIVKSNMIPSALEHLQEIAARSGRTAVFLDYDGTLTPIVLRPEEAILSSSMREVLRALAAKVPVAILSGRDLEDLRQRVSIEGIVYAGSHGFDIVGPRGLRKQVAPEFLPILEDTEKELKQKLRDIAGAQLERKRFSIAAHFREVPDERTPQVEQAVSEVAARHRKLRKTAGKKVYELQPDVDWNKGKALLWLLEAMGLDPEEMFPIYIGDDLTDEDAFRAVERCGVGIVVNEKPRATAARYFLKDPVEVELFLREILARLRDNSHS